MIKTAGFCKKRRIKAITIEIVFLCILVLTVFLMTSCNKAGHVEGNFAQSTSTGEAANNAASTNDKNNYTNVIKSADLDEAISHAIKSQGVSYYSGEASTEGHMILGTEEKENKVIVYTLSSFGSFGFENGIFTKVGGSGSIPTVMTFSKNEKGEYILQEYKEPLDGTEYERSVKEMFPEKYWDKVFDNESYKELAKQQEEQAAAYLKSIGRNAQVSASFVEKKPLDIDVNVLNELFSNKSKNDAFINNCPDWIGTREVIENGIRYIYETSQGKTPNGHDLITFKKSKEDGTVIEERKYVIVGSELQLQ